MGFRISGLGFKAWGSGFRITRPDPQPKGLNPKFSPATLGVPKDREELLADLCVAVPQHVAAVDVVLELWVVCSGFRV